MKERKRSFNKFWLLWLSWSVLKPLPRLPSVRCLFISHKQKNCFHLGASQSIDFLVSLLKHTSIFGWNWKQILPHIAMHFLLHFIGCYIFCRCRSIRTDRNINLIDKFDILPLCPINFRWNFVGEWQNNWHGNLRHENNFELLWMAWLVRVNVRLLSLFQWEKLRSAEEMDPELWGTSGGRWR